MRCSSASAASSTTSGARSTRTGTCWTSWSRAGAIRRQPNGSSASCCVGCSMLPRVIVTDKLKSYGAAKRTILPHVEHWQSKYLNNRIEVSHQPRRRQERQTQRFKSARHPSSRFPPALQAKPLLLPPNAFCPPTPASTTTSSSAAIASPPLNTVPPATLLSAFGVRSPRLLMSHKHRSRLQVFDTLRPPT